MKLINNNLSPLPFYDDISLQNHRKDYAFGQVYPLTTRANFLLPFQFVADVATSFSFVRLYDFNNPAQYIDITQSMREGGMQSKQYSNFTLFKYPAKLPIVEIKHEGLYYIAIRTSKGAWLYSEVFSINFSVDDFLLLEYYNSYNFSLKNGIVDFSDAFKFKCYLPTQVGKPEYNFEEEATERIGYTFIESQISKKIYKFTFLAPEYLCDALRIVRLCDNKTITSKGQIYDLTTFNMDVEWQDQGDLAAVECEFETDTVIANIGGYSPDLIGGDFNNDFDNDFYDQQLTIDINVMRSADKLKSVAERPVKSKIVIGLKGENSYGQSYSGTSIIEEGETESVEVTISSDYTIKEVMIDLKGDNDKTNYNAILISD